MRKTKIISGFPGTGKTHFYINETKLHVLDSDISKFDKSNFPANYIAHIKENIGKVDIIFISSNLDVRKAMYENHINFTLIYPKYDLKKEYLERYTKRGSSLTFINLIRTCWDEWMQDLYTEDFCTNYIRLDSNQYIKNVINKIK
jgi:hypothetical protein